MGCCEQISEQGRELGRFVREKGMTSRELRKKLIHFLSKTRDEDTESVDSTICSQDLRDLLWLDVITSEIRVRDSEDEIFILGLGGGRTDRLSVRAGVQDALHSLLDRLQSVVATHAILRMGVELLQDSQTVSRSLGRFVVIHERDLRGIPRMRCDLVDVFVLETEKGFHDQERGLQHSLQAVVHTVEAIHGTTRVQHEMAALQNFPLLNAGTEFLLRDPSAAVD